MTKFRVRHEVTDDCEDPARMDLRFWLEVVGLSVLFGSIIVAAIKLTGRETEVIMFAILLGMAKLASLMSHNS
jgi:hypothetical protein